MVGIKCWLEFQTVEISAGFFKYNNFLTALLEYLKHLIKFFKKIFGRTYSTMSSSIYWLKSITKIKPVISHEEVINTFILSCLDKNNTLYMVISSYSFIFG